jgi:hypothetical protein
VPLQLLGRLLQLFAAFFRWQHAAVRSRVIEHCATGTPNVDRTVVHLAVRAWAFCILSSLVFRDGGNGTRLV